MLVDVRHNHDAVGLYPNCPACGTMVTEGPRGLRLPDTAGATCVVCSQTVHTPREAAKCLGALNGSR